MLGRILSYLDSLFYTTTITTVTRVTTTTFHSEDFSSTDETDTVETNITMEGDTFLVNGRAISIPAVVKNRPPISKESFPYFMDKSILMEIVTKDRLIFFRDETRLSNSTGVRSHTVKRLLDDVRSDIQGDSIWTQSKSYSEDNDIIVVCMNGKAVFISFEKNDGTYVTIYHENENLMSSDTECVVAAYAYARAYIINTCVLATPSLDEDTLATTLLAMMLVERI